MIPTKSDLVTGFANVVSIKKNGSLYQMTSSCCWNHVINTNRKVEM